MTTEPSWLNPCEPTDPELLGAFKAEAEKRELLFVLEEGRRAIGDHFAPHDCYATGPLTGDHFRDLVECPACSFIKMYDVTVAKYGRGTK